MPESARRAIAETMADLGRYPDSNGFALKSALSAKFNVPTDWITLGNGSNDILELAAAALLSPGPQLRLRAAFVCRVCAGNAGARSARDRGRRAKDLGHDLDAMASAIAADTALVYIANPNNPTGTHLPAETIAGFLARVPARKSSS